jgi:hypothetical protein
LGLPETFPDLVKSLEDSHPDIHWTAARALLRRHESILIPLPFLLKKVRQTAGERRNWTILALGRIGGHARAALHDLAALDDTENQQLARWARERIEANAEPLAY